MNPDPGAAVNPPSRSSPSHPPDHSSKLGRTSEEDRTTAGDGGDCHPQLEALQADLRDVFYELYRQRQESTGLRSEPRSTVLQLSLKIAPSLSGQPPGDQLYQQVKQAATLCADRHAAFPSGHVYCYWCRSFACPHSSPPESRYVFAGYSPTGQPLWQEYSTVLLERGDSRIELLFQEDSAAVTLVQGDAELNTNQLAVYGKRSPIYRILGQVVLGYLLPPQTASGNRSPFAVTFQAVEAAAGNSPAQLNVLGILADGTPAADALEESFDPRLLDAVRSTRRRLAEVALSRVSRRRRSREKSRRVLEVLRLLAKNFDRIFRQGKRRTRHSQHRHRNPQRPASVALQDALNARRDALYRDIEERTWVVLGPKNRVHIFNDAAMHVTSVAYPGETVRQRTTRGKWLSPSEEETRRFFTALRSRSATE